MNNFIKRCLVVASGLCAIGLVLILIGGIFGGLRQTEEIALRGGFSYPFYANAAVFETVVVNSDIDIKADDFFYTETAGGYYENDNICAKEEIEELSMQVGTCEFEVQEWDGDVYKIAAQNVPDLKCSVQNGTLYIKNIRHHLKFSSKERLMLYVPKGAEFEFVKLELGAGKGTIKGLTAEEMTVEVGAGELICRDLTLDKLRMEIGAGKADCSNCTVQDVRFEAGAGKLSYDGNISGDLDVSCALGEIEISIDGKYQDYDYDIEAALGSVTIDQQSEGRITFSGISEKRVDNGAGKKMDLECAMGNIDISFE